MYLAIRSMVLAGLFFFLVAGATRSQDDDTALIDDLPKEKKDAAQSEAKRAVKPQARPRRDGDAADLPPEDILPRIPGKSPPLNADRTTLIDDRRAERREAERDAAKAGNAIPDNLADALAQSMHNSPAVLVAEAKLRQAQAELNEVRQTVVHDLTLAYQRRSHNKWLTKEMSESVPAAQLREAQLALQEDEAKIVYLLGVGGTITPASNVSRTGVERSGEKVMVEQPAGEVAKPANAEGQKMEEASYNVLREAWKHANPKPEFPEYARAFLEKRIDLDFTEQSLREVLDYINQAGDGSVEFVIQTPEEWEPQPGDEVPVPLVTLSLKHVTIAAALQALADRYDCAFVFRDYGVLVLGPGVSTGETAVNSFRTAGTPMIAPPMNNMGGMGGMGMGGGMMGGMGGGIGGMGGGSGQ